MQRSYFTMCRISIEKIMIKNLIQDSITTDRTYIYIYIYWREIIKKLFENIYAINNF